LPNDLIVPAGKTATLRSTRRGTYLNDLAGLSGSLTGSGTLNLIVNFSSAAITGDWSAFSGILNVTRPTTAIDDPRFQLGNELGLPLATVNLDQVTLVYTAAPPPEGVVIPIGSLSGTANATTIIAGTQTGFGPVTWQVGSLNTSTTFAGNFTPYGNASIGLEKVGSGTWTLTGTGTVSAGITVKNGTLSYGDDPTDTLGGTSEITIDPDATLQLNSGAKIIGSACEIFTGGTLRGTGTLQAPLISIGTIIPTGGTLTLAGNANLTGKVEFSTPTGKPRRHRRPRLAGPLQLPTGLPAGRNLLITYTGTWAPEISHSPMSPPTLLATLDLHPRRNRRDLIDQSAYQDWQIENFGTLETPMATRNADPDDDGMTNLEEFEAGTDPNDDDLLHPPHLARRRLQPLGPRHTAAWLENTTPRVFRNHRHVIINDSGSNSPPSISSAPSSPVRSPSPTPPKPSPFRRRLDLRSHRPHQIRHQHPHPRHLQQLLRPHRHRRRRRQIQSATALGTADRATTVANNARLELQNNITVTGETLTLSGHRRHHHSSTAPQLEIRCQHLDRPRHPRRHRHPHRRAGRRHPHRLRPDHQRPRQHRPHRPPRRHDRHGRSIRP
jgi:autotransporter-associated beta strand protein